MLEQYVAAVRDAVGMEIPLSMDHLGHLGVKSIIRLGNTVSMGVAVAKGPTKVEELLSRTDDALYRAKRNGRNRVESDQGTTDDRTPEMTAPPATIP